MRKVASLIRAEALLVPALAYLVVLRRSPHVRTLSNVFAEVHDGMYKQWQVDDRDIAEVLAYRAGIAGTAIATVLVALSANTSLIDLPPPAINAACACGALSLGMSLYLVHMYVTAIKRVIQVRIQSQENVQFLHVQFLHDLQAHRCAKHVLFERMVPADACL